MYTPEKLEIPAMLFNFTNDTRIDLPVVPEEIPDNYSAEFENLPVIGRSTPYAGYSGGGPRTVDMDLKLHADYCENNDLLSVVRQIQSISYPEYSNYVEPPEIYLRVGDFIRIKGYCDNVNVTWKKPYGRTRSGKIIYYNADVSFSISEALKVALSASDIMSNQYPEGGTS